MGFWEAIMLVCFGISWPMSIHKTIKVKNPAGKSVAFLWLIVIGYIAGCIHKICYNCNWVLWLYVFNLLMVSADLYFVLKYKRILARKAQTAGQMETK